MITKFVIRNKETGKFLSAKSGGVRSYGHVQDAQLWSKRHHAQLAVNYRNRAEQLKLEIVEFNVLLVDARKGYIG